MHFLVAVDGSEAAFRALKFAARLAAGRNSKFTIISVRQYVVGTNMAVAVWPQEEIDALLSKVKKLARDAGVKQILATELKERDIAHAIINSAEEHKVDLVVMGASGMSNFKALMIGSVSAEVLKKSVCPVAIVH